PPRLRRRERPALSKEETSLRNARIQRSLLLECAVRERVGRSTAGGPRTLRGGRGGAPGGEAGPMNEGQVTGSGPVPKALPNRETHREGNQHQQRDPDTDH